MNADKAGLQAGVVEVRFRDNAEDGSPHRAFCCPGTRIWRRLAVCFTVVLLIALLSPPESVRAERLEIPGERTASEILPKYELAGPYFQVRDEVASHDYMNHYTVDSTFGVFEVTGDGALRKLEREIQAIATLARIKKTGAYADAVKRSALQPLLFGRDLVTDPVDTVTGIPRGIVNIVENVATGLTTTSDPSEDDVAKKLLTVSSSKREYAYRLGVDVYSSNLELQRELNSVAWASALGGLTLTAAMFPIQAPAIQVFKGMSLAGRVNNTLRDHPPPRLRMMNEEQLLAMGIPPDLVRKFLDHPSFTPRHDTIIVECLGRLEGANGRDAFVRSILVAEDEESANFYQHVAETIRGYHETVSPITEITVVDSVIAAISEEEATLIPFPVDHVIWTARISRILDGVASYHSATGSQGEVDLWLTGTMSSYAKEQAEQLGIGVAEDVDKRIELID